METICEGDTVVYRSGKKEVVEYFYYLEGSPIYPYVVNDDSYTPDGCYYPDEDSPQDIINVLKKDRPTTPSKCRGDCPEQEYCSYRKSLKLAVIDKMIKGLEEMKENI
jgi:hypothetical protein